MQYQVGRDRVKFVQRFRDLGTSVHASEQPYGSHENTITCAYSLHNKQSSFINLSASSYSLLGN